MKRRRRYSAFTCSDDEDDAGTSSDDGSSANEYAEGLGCADRKRCREKATSGFAFDMHPREEYFEEPAPNHSAIQSDDEEPSPSLAAVGMEWQTSLGRLAELERMEAEQERYTKWHMQQHQKRLARLRQKCQLREAVRSGTCPQGMHVKSKSTKVSLAAQTAKSTAVVQDLCMKLQKLRAPAEQGVLTPADTEKVLHILNGLAACHMTVRTLKSTGVGRELNLRTWRCNNKTAIARVSTELLARWREAVRDHNSGTAAV
mmetsp:Transcript_7385/g.13123  ORF Transcript_7385/g.13123 Transcript_7385/m.13123 type:complete len:259 (-) Transcript_7385:99-875(-)